MWIRFLLSPVTLHLHDPDFQHKVQEEKVPMKLLVEFLFPLKSRLAPTFFLEGNLGKRAVKLRHGKFNLASHVMVILHLSERTSVPAMQQTNVQGTKHWVVHRFGIALSFIYVWTLHQFVGRKKKQHVCLKGFSKGSEPQGKLTRITHCADGIVLLVTPLGTD